MTTKLKSSAEIKSAFDQLFGQLTENDILDNEAKIIMFRFLSIIDAKREELGWSRKDLAVKIGITPSYISQLFQGDKLLNMYTLAKFQRVLNLQFEVRNKQTYEEIAKTLSPIPDGKGFWIYHSFKEPNYESSKQLPVIAGNPKDFAA